MSAHVRIDGADLARAARTLVGVRFRLHGRDPARALDCVGVLGAALERCGLASAGLPGGYPLRTTRPPDFARIAARLGLVAGADEHAPGTILLLRTAACQYHVAIVTRPGPIAVHAHAGLGRVVEGPITPDWPRLHRWCLPCQPLAGSEPLLS
ncbi:hypothetical protein MTR62_18775 [Novosphingobium sp. 1949]|uniref:Peptidoglycan endopeptidase n=1 Tax=Novosphingobium organovorum TaxID=2930092 RepID=A0ABT0BI37_9SPHN|nr:hypothetical protein [Novosphingobium organovorum]MCJ2184717.1 hypothetical protein [Novosphingobium organovorum]